MSRRALKAKIKKMIKEKERGKSCYARADALLQEVRLDLAPGESVDLGDGQTATLVDKFAEKNTVFKPCGVSRFELQLSRA